MGSLVERATQRAKNFEGVACRVLMISLALRSEVDRARNYRKYCNGSSPNQSFGFIDFLLRCTVPPSELSVGACGPDG